MSPSRGHPLRIQLDPRLGQPVYQQIVGQIQRHAGTLRLPAGVQLPTVRELARQLGVNFNTVARAYRLLARSGTLSAQPGRGTFVLESRVGRNPGRAALRELTAEYISDARRMEFSDAQIAGALKRGLGRPTQAPHKGDSYE